MYIIEYKLNGLKLYEFPHKLVYTDTGNINHWQLKTPEFGIRQGLVTCLALTNFRVADSGWTENFESTPLIGWVTSFTLFCASWTFSVNTVDSMMVLSIPAVTLIWHTIRQIPSAAVEGRRLISIPESGESCYESLNANLRLVLLTRAFKQLSLT
jgi:hypothetical protein